MGYKNFLQEKNTPFGEYLVQHNIKHEWIAKKSGISRSWISYLCVEHDRKPRISTAKKIIKPLKEFNPKIDVYDFWSY